MGIKDIYMLPATLKEDIDIYIKNSDINSGDIMKLIKGRYKSKVNFTKNDLIQYLEERREELNAPTLDEANIIPLPRKIDTEMNNIKDETLDKADTVDVRNRARLLEIFKEKIWQRIKIIENQQKIGDKTEIDPYLESLIINYFKLATDIVEKEVKLQLEVEESSKLDKMVDERINIVLFLIAKIVKKYVKDKEFKKLSEEVEELFGNYGIRIEGKIKR